MLLYLLSHRMLPLVSLLLSIKMLPLVSLLLTIKMLPLVSLLILPRMLPHCLFLERCLNLGRGRCKYKYLEI